jgi:serine/threonine-protein kinase
MSNDAKLPQPGEIVDGKYRVDSLLGQGGMGAVFVVRHVQTQRQFALKCMLAALVGDYEAEQRFLREAKLAGNVDHPGVVATYDVGRHHGLLYMVMELLSGESLGARLARGAYSVAEGTHVMTTVLAAVSAAHQKGIVHRDLKPDNIFLHRGPDGRGTEPKILDFGISKALSPDGKPTMGLTKTGMILGTPLYMSPEQVRGSKTLDQRTDVYALGVILYEMLAGVVPYNGNNFADLVLKIVTADTVPPSKHVASIPPALDAVIMRAMHIDPDARFADAMAFAQALAPFAVAPVYGSVRPPSGLSTPPPPSRASYAAAAPVPAQSLTPFSAEARIDPLPVHSVPWPVFAVAAAAVLAGAWFLFAGGAGQAKTAQPNLPSTVSPVAAAQPPRAAPVGIIPTQPLQGTHEIPMGVSGDSVVPSVVVTDVHHRSDRERGHDGAGVPVVPVVQQLPQAAPEPLVEPVEPPRPSNDQIIDPFAE